MPAILKTLALVLLCAGLSSAPAQAQAPDRTPQEIADKEVVSTLASSASFTALGQNAPQLKAILDRAPASYPLVERRGEVVILRDDGQSQAFVLGLLLVAAKENRKTSVVRAYNTYAMAAALLATYEVEMKRPAGALVYLDRGLKLQPDNSHLVSEKAAALFALHRVPEGLALVSDWLEKNPLAGDDNRARLLRSKGFAMIEMQQLDGAETAYRESLKLAPTHKGTQQELEYIAKLKAGGKQVKGGLFTSDKAAEGNLTAPKESNP